MRRSIAWKALAISAAGAGAIAVLQLAWGLCPESRGFAWDRRIADRAAWLPAWSAVFWIGGFVGLHASVESAAMAWPDALILGAICAVPCALAARAFCMYLGADGVLLLAVAIVALVCAVGSGALRS